MSEQTYNGWTNYATWRVRLEMFDGFEPDDAGFTEKPDVHTFAAYLRDLVAEHIHESELCKSPLVAGWAQAFTDEANYHEIAEAMLDDWRDES
jgi:hypothetical protein